MEIVLTRLWHSLQQYNKVYMNITETVIEKAKDLLQGEPAGLRYAKLHAAIRAALPNVNVNTITGSLNRFRSSLPEFNPEKGFYRSPNFTDAEPVLAPTSGKIDKQSQIKEDLFYKPFSEWLTNELQEASKSITLGGNRFKDKWGTPDVIGVLRPKPTDIFTFPLEILSAEIKSDSAGLITAFGQACSYKLFSHRSYIVVPAASVESDISRLDSLCMIFGIGLIVFDALNPQNPDFKIRTRAARHEPDMFYVNKYVREVADELLS